MEKLVGLGYHLRPNQLDFIAGQSNNIDFKTIYAKLDDFLQKDIHGKSSRVKVATILLRVWCLVPSEYQMLRDQALELYSRLTPLGTSGFALGDAPFNAPVFQGHHCRTGKSIHPPTRSFVKPNIS